MSFDAEKPQCGKGWANRCAHSRGKKCQCRCGGRNHGAAYRRSVQLGVLGSVYNICKSPPAVRQDTLFRFVRSADRSSDDTYTGVLVDGVPLPQQIVDHSPTGFEFGYGGSGPADLALNILALFVSLNEAHELHQDFKWAFIAPAKPNDTLPVSAVRTWIAAKQRRAAEQQEAM